MRAKRQPCGSDLAAPQHQGERIYWAAQNPTHDVVGCPLAGVSNEEVYMKIMRREKITLSFKASGLFISQAQITLVMNITWMLWDLDRHNAEYNVLAYFEPYEDVERFSQARAEPDLHHLQGYLCNMKDTVLSFDVNGSTWLWTIRDDLPNHDACLESFGLSVPVFSDLTRHLKNDVTQLLMFISAVCRSFCPPILAGSGWKNKSSINYRKPTK